MSKLTKGEQFIFDWHHGYSGSFMSNLAICIQKADVYNTLKLKLAYPEEVQAMYNFQNKDGYWEYIEEKVKNNA